MTGEDAMTEEASSTPAREYLSKRQRRYPPRYAAKAGADRAQQLYHVLAPGLPRELQKRVADGVVAIGEVGDNVPDVRTIPVAPDGFVVEFTSGMMDFQYAVARALAGLDQGNTILRSKPQGFGDVTRLVERVLRRSARYVRWFWLWPWRRIENPDFPIAKDVHDWIEMIVTMGELFLLAHELGHVALNSGIVKPVYENDEVNADHYGFEFLLPEAEKRWHKRVAYAGPVIPIRIFASLERLGVQFSDRYPPQAERVKLLREQVHKMCPSEQYFHEVTTIMVAWQDMLDDIENHIDPKSTRALPDAERVLVRLIAELEEVAKGNVKLDTFVTNIGFLAKAYPAETIKQAARMLVKDYTPPRPPPGGFLREELRATMAQKLTELLTRLPTELRPLFPPGEIPKDKRDSPASLQ